MVGVVLACCRPHSSLWFPAYAGMTVWWDCLAITLTFDSSPIKGEVDKDAGMTGRGFSGLGVLDGCVSVVESVR